MVRQSSSRSGLCCRAMFHLTAHTIIFLIRCTKTTESSIKSFNIVFFFRGLLHSREKTRSRVIPMANALFMHRMFIFYIRWVSEEIIRFEEHQKTSSSITRADCVYFRQSEQWTTYDEKNALWTPYWLKADPFMMVNNVFIQLKVPLSFALSCLSHE